MENNRLVTAEDQERDNVDNIIDFAKERGKRLATGSKEPPSGIWLKDLTEGTIFLVRRKNQGQDFTLGYFMIVDKTEKAVMLQEKSTPHVLPVDPIRFCNVFELFEILQDGEITRAQLEMTEEKEEGDSNGNSDRSDQSGRLADDADVKE